VTAEFLVDGYEGACEYDKPIYYQSPDGQTLDVTAIMALVDVSRDCKQEISWTCNSAQINHHLRAEFVVTYWENRIGDPVS